MSTIHFHETTTATPEQFVAGLTDFGPGRSELFREQRRRRPGGAFSERHGGRRHRRLGRHLGAPALRLVRSRITSFSKTTDSNTWGGNSSHTYDLKRNPDGTTDIDYVVVRDGKNLKGKFLGVVLGSVGKGRLKSAFDNAVKAIEARNNGAARSMTQRARLGHARDRRERARHPRSGRVPVSALPRRRRRRPLSGLGVLRRPRELGGRLRRQRR